MCGVKPCDSPNCTWGEKHRKECEAREVMRWSREKRAEYYADVKKRRGESALKELIEEVNKQWQSKDGKAMADAVEKEVRERCGIRNTRK